MATAASLRDNQRRAVESEARRICVNAGPGSGKTRVLVERIARGARDKRLALDRVLALTFTENAAAEMKQRLAAKFPEPELRRQVELAAVSTIHGFCAMLLRDYAVEAGVDPRFRVLDEVEAALLRVRVLDRVLNRFREAQPEAFEEFGRHFRNEVAHALLAAYEEIHNQGGDLSDPAALLRPRHTSAEICKLVEARMTRLGNLAHSSFADQRFQQQLAIMLQAVQRALRFHQAGNLATALAAIEDARKPIDLKKVKAADLKDALRVLRDKDRDLRDALDPLPEKRPLDTLEALKAMMVEEAAAPQRQRVAVLLGEFEAGYRSEKARLSALDFDDLEHRAWSLLENDAVVRAAAARFQEILVDEYQDTSRLQARILERLGADLRMFTVGDPKQSIYAFRNAEPKNFDDAWQTADPQGQIPLVEDFRSRPEIVAAVNTYFSQVTGFGGAAGYQALQAVEQFDAKSEPSVELWITTHDGDAEDGRQAEAALLARAIRERVEGQRLKITNRDAPDYRGGRPAGYGDIAMLFRSTTSMGLYEAALREHGVPYYAETGRGFYDTREVADISNFLRLLDNERDELAMAAVLRSPMFALSDDALYLLAVRARETQGARLCDVLDTDGLPDSDRRALERFRDVYSRLRHESQWRGLDSLIREIVHATGYIRALHASPNGARRVANVLKLAGLARSWTASSLGIASPGDLARAIDQFRCDEVRAGEAQTPAAEGAVLLMTMHAAKGLEFPVVILPNLDRGGKRDHAEIEYSAEHGLGCSFRVQDDDTEPVETLTQLNIRWDKHARDEREEQRVLFVAMTRAREHLILSGAIKPRKAGGFGPLDNYLCMVAEPQMFAAADISAAEAAGAQPMAPRLIPVPLEGDPDAADQSDSIAAVTDIAEFASCPRRYYLGRYLGWRSFDESAVGGETDDAVSSAGRGTLVHELLAGKPGEYPAEIQQLAERFWASDLGRRVAATPDRKAEHSIAGKVDGHFLNGVLDVQAGPLLVDYKTGRREDGAYRLQMLLYALLTGAQEAWLFYLDENAAAPVELTPANLAEAREAVERFFTAQRTLDFPAVVEEHCGRCPFAGRQCREPERRQASAAGPNP